MKTTYDYNIKSALLRFCRDKKISQVEISRITQTSVHNVNRWFNHKYGTMPPVSVVVYLAKNHGLKIDDLIEKSGGGNNGER